MPKQQLKRISPHQTAKVAAILMAIGSVPFVLVFGLAAMLVPMPAGEPGFTPFTGLSFLVFPILYFVLGYVCTAAGCWFYNLMYPYIGGIEVEFEEK